MRADRRFPMYLVLQSSFLQSQSVIAYRLLKVARRMSFVQFYPTEKIINNLIHFRASSSAFSAWSQLLGRFRKSEMPREWDK